MSMNTFGYTPKDIKECILYTESRLRKIISDIMFETYGQGWENKALDPEKIELKKNDGR